MGGAEHDRGFEVPAHAHAAAFEAVVAGQLVEQGEERRRFDAERRDAHQAGERDIGGTGLLQQGWQVRDRDAAFLIFSADVDLDEAGHLPAGLVHRPGEGRDEAGPVQRMDRVEQLHCLVGLVRLQPADEMEVHIGIALAQRGPFGLGFLDAVFAEDAAAGLDQRGYGFGGMGLADGDESDLGALAAGEAAGVGDAVFETGQQGGCTFHWLGYSGRMSSRQPLPNLWLLSDERNDSGVNEALDRLPEHSGLVFRHYHLGPEQRRTRFEELAKRCRTRRHLVILAGKSAMAREWGADGAYGSVDSLHKSGENGLRLATVHDEAEIDAANRAEVDAMFLSPVFATRSHPGAAGLGKERFLALAARAEAPVIALGGMNAARAAELGWPRWAAIDGLS